MSQYLFDNGRLSRFVSNGNINDRACSFLTNEWYWWRSWRLAVKWEYLLILHSSSQNETLLHADTGRAREKKGRLIRLIVVTRCAYASEKIKIVHVTNKWLARASGLANYRHDWERIIEVGILRCCCHLLSTGYFPRKAFFDVICKWVWSLSLSSRFIRDQDQDGVAFVWHSLLFEKRLPMYVVHSHLIRKIVRRTLTQHEPFCRFSYPCVKRW